MKKINNKTLIIVLAVVFGIGIMFYLATSVVPKSLITLTKASSYDKLALSGSYLIGERILAKADGVEKCKVNVFILDTDGKGIPGKTVKVSGMDGIKAINAVTDKSGKASFEMTSTAEGQFPLTATVDGAALAKKVTVTFRN